MMKILYVINSIKNNGPTNVLINMVKNIDKNKFKVNIMTIINENDIELIKLLKNIGINIIELNYKKSFWTLFKSKEIIEIVKKEEFDIIHTHCHVPTIMLRNIDKIKVATVHNRIYEDFKDSYGKIKGTILSFLYINALKKYDCVVGCSKSVYEYCKNYIKKIYYVRNGIESDKKISNEDLRKKYNIPKDAIVYIYAGNLNYNKDVMGLVDKFDKIHNKNEYLILLGNGILFDKVKEYESTNIKVIGFVDNPNIFLNISNVYVSFSKTEGFPISVIEALSNNLLVLLSDIPAHNEFMEIDNNYYIGEVFNYFNFKNKLLNIRKNLNKEIKSFEFKEKYLSAKDMMKKYQKIYLGLLQNYKKLK